MTVIQILPQSLLISEELFKKIVVKLVVKLDENSNSHTAGFKIKAFKNM